ncbi:CDP-glycerol glycerophosphotransferase family protein [Arthrobacter castelli]|uniref:CDP-glycerol glycerophosphotransferase family protein n=1 Tax=Arthrobacter castelli TaxID=271431 RepID=UPI00047D9F66|nr:CDP-glycerol glycerophosphotransferase family protein [Arthrobacter castelli]
MLEIFSSQVGNALAAKRVRARLKQTHPVKGPVECVLYFADEPVNSYQVRQWYEPMLRLADSHRVTVMVRKPMTVRSLHDCPLPMVLATNMPEQEAFLSAHPVKIIFYVNNNKENFLTLRYTGPIHIHLSHGESDKTSMASNQLKAYDYAFIAGEASRSRIERTVKRLDPDHLVQIGRPQLDAPQYQHQLPDDGRTVVLYAPTWEGERSAMAYGSVASHGTAMISALLSDPSIRVIYRPHPRVGVREAVQSRASKAIKTSINAANDADPSACHLVDEQADFRWSLSVADIGIVDISAMAADWLATRKPMVITRPSNPHAHVDPAGIAGSLDLLSAGRADDVLQLVAELKHAGPSAAQLGQVEHHFGDTTPGNGTRRFLRAVDRVLAE